MGSFDGFLGLFSSNLASLDSNKAGLIPFNMGFSFWNSLTIYKLLLKAILLLPYNWSSNLISNLAILGSVITIDSLLRTMMLYKIWKNTGQHPSDH